MCFIALSRQLHAALHPAGALLAQLMPPLPPLPPLPTLLSPCFPAAPPSTDLDLVVSGAADGALLLHSLTTGAYVRRFTLPHGVPPALLAIAPKLGEGPRGWGALLPGLQAAWRAGSVAGRPCRPSAEPCTASHAEPCCTALCCAVGALLVHSHVDLALHLYSVNCRHLASAGAVPRRRAACCSAYLHGCLPLPPRSAQRAADASSHAHFPQTLTSGWPRCAPRPTAAYCWQLAPADWPRCAGSTRCRLVGGAGVGRGGARAQCLVGWCKPAGANRLSKTLIRPPPSLLQAVLRYDSGRGPVTALALTPEGCVLAGTAEGSVVLFAPDNRRTITTRPALAD